MAAGSALRAVENLELKPLTSDPIITSDPFTTSPHCDFYPLLLSGTGCLLTMCPHKAFRAGGGAPSPRRCTGRCVSKAQGGWGIRDSSLRAVLSRPVLSNSCDPTDSSPPGSSVHGDSPGKNPGVGCHALLQGIFPTQGSNLGLPHCRRVLYHLIFPGGSDGEEFAC